MRKPLHSAAVSLAAASHSTCRSSLADPRLSTSISRQQFRKSRNTADSRSGFCSSGVPFVAIRYNAYRKRKHKTPPVSFHIHICSHRPHFLRSSLQWQFLPWQRVRDNFSIPTEKNHPDAATAIPTSK